MKEKKWAEIPGWPGYRVSDNGEVQSCRDCAGYDSGAWHYISLFTDKGGYKKFTLHYRQRTAFVGVHVVVLSCFGGRRPPGNSMGLHKNGIRDDNRIENLYWGFADDNARDRDKHGKTARFERNGNAKLTWDQVEIIRSLQGTFTSSILGKRFNVDRSTIKKIWNNKIWAKKPLAYHPPTKFVDQDNDWDSSEGNQ